MEYFNTQYSTCFYKKPFQLLKDYKLDEYMADFPKMSLSKIFQIVTTIGFKFFSRSLYLWNLSELPHPDTNI